MDIFLKLYLAIVFIAMVSDAIFNIKLMFFGTKNSRLRTSTIIQMLVWTTVCSLIPILNIILMITNIKSIFMGKVKFIEAHADLIYCVNSKSAAK